MCMCDAEGKLKHRLDPAEHSEPTNCCIGDGKLYVTLSGSGQLAAIDYPDAALPLYPARS